MGNAYDPLWGLRLGVSLNCPKGRATWAKTLRLESCLECRTEPSVGLRLLSCMRWKRSPLHQDTAASSRLAILSCFLEATRSSPRCLPFPPSLSSFACSFPFLSFFLPLPLHLLHPSHQGSHRILGATALCLSASCPEPWPLRRHPPLLSTARASVIACAPWWGHQGARVDRSWIWTNDALVFLPCALEEKKKP